MIFQTLFLVAIAAGLTAGCSTMRAETKQPIKLGQRSIEVANLNGFDAALFTPPNPYVNNNEIIIDQEPVRRKHTDIEVALVWRLDQDQPYSFPDNNAIVLIGTAQYPLPVPLDCGTVGPKRKVFACVYTRTGPADWKYTVRVRNDENPTELPKLDPSVHQN